MSSPWLWKPGHPFIDLEQPHTSRVWHRAIWPGELTLAIGKIVNPGLMDILISCIINPSMSSRITAEAERRATRRLRWQHPAIALNVTFPPMTGLEDFKPFEGTFTYEAPITEEDVNNWLGEVVHDGMEYAARGSVREVIETVRERVGAVDKTRSKWLLEVYYIHPENAVEHAVVLHVSHVLFDGIGAFQVLTLWLHQLAYVLSHEDEVLHWGEEHDRLPPAMPDRMAIPWTPEPVPADHIMVQKIVSALKRPPPNVKLPVLNPDAQPSLSGHLTKTFPPEFAEKIRLAARAHGCSILSTVFAANYLTLLHLLPRKQIPDEELFVHIYPAGADLRSRYLLGGPERQKDVQNWEIGLTLGGNVIGAYHLERFLDSNKLKDVWTVAREVQAQMLEQQPYQATAAQWVPAIIAAMIHKHATDFEPESPDHRSVNVSSLGLVDQHLSKTYGPSSSPVFTISEPLMSSIGPTLTPDGVGVLLAPYTWDGIFRLSFNYATAYMGTEKEQTEAEKEGKVTLRRYVEELVRLLERLAEDRVPEMPKPKL
ncbi:hypothetical protein DACRYDRAFT_14207 [Dacryopinax primogenitus]|uniref:Diacylglycerol O-acyltransferase n=1 Tax=Dacryopinax primogenitus (strain DJM 731) TaxID=1858805 RepID=M5GF96_DACPD|nr:uncharacterized protein DACRYDRAFT_14207 [Dacryopinax primogenitus]EJU03968.1 hypothetical protein DACRYDRAFT_14207 [Dacryopinax primogenitus]